MIYSFVYILLFRLSRFQDKNLIPQQSHYLFVYDLTIIIILYMLIFF